MSSCSRICRVHFLNKNQGVLRIILQTAALLNYFDTFPTILNHESIDKHLINVRYDMLLNKVLILNNIIKA